MRLISAKCADSLQIRPDLLRLDDGRGESEKEMSDIGIKKGRRSVLFNFSYKAEIISCLIEHRNAC